MNLNSKLRRQKWEEKRKRFLEDLDLKDSREFLLMERAMKKKNAIKLILGFLGIFLGAFVIWGIIYYLF